MPNACGGSNRIKLFVCLFVLMIDKQMKSLSADRYNPSALPQPAEYSNPLQFMSQMLSDISALMHYL